MAAALSRFSAVVLVVITLFTARPASSATYHVSKSGNDDNGGSNWEDAFLTITRGLASAQSEDQVWVAEGIYQEGATVEIPENVSLFGGFEGNGGKNSAAKKENQPDECG